MTKVVVFFSAVAFMACGGASKAPESAPASPTRFEFAPRFECDARFVCEAFVASDGHLRTVIPFAHGPDGKCYGMDGTVVVDEAGSTLRRVSDGETVGVLSSMEKTGTGAAMRCVKE